MTTNINTLLSGLNGTTITNISGNIGAVGSSASNLSPWGSFSLDELDDTVLDKNLVKKYEIYESTEDLLVLSCVWYRLRQEQRQNPSKLISSGISKLLDSKLFKVITAEDRELASKIRDYYSKKIMMAKLKDTRPLSKYREDLNMFIHSDGTKVVESTFGLAYRLPQFYFYDLKMEEIFADKLKTTSKDIKGRYTKTLTFIDKTVVDRKVLKRNEYWFTDEDNAVVNICLSVDNALTKVWEKVIENPIRLEGLYYLKSRDGIGYYQAEKYELVG